VTLADRLSKRLFWKQIPYQPEKEDSMRSRAISRAQNDGAVLFALGCAAAAAFVGQFAFGTHPSYFLPVGICALPYAASRNREVAYRVGAAAALILFVAAVGIRQGSLFLPSLAALLVATYRAAAATATRRPRRRR
jgi:hypothetical protein